MIITSNNRIDFYLSMDDIGLKERISNDKSVLIKINLARPPVSGHPRTDVGLLIDVIKYIYSNGGTCAIAEGANGYLRKNLAEVGLSEVISRFQIEVIDLDLETVDPIIMNGDVHYLPQCLKHYELRIAIPVPSKRPGMIFSNNVKLFVGAVPRSMYQLDNQVVDWRPRVHIDLHKSVADIYRSVQGYAPFHFFINGGVAMAEDIGEFQMKEILIGNDGLELDDYVLNNYFGNQKPPEYMERLKET